MRFAADGSRQAGRDPDREDGHYADIYIDYVNLFNKIVSETLLDKN